MKVVLSDHAKGIKVNITIALVIALNHAKSLDGHHHSAHADLNLGKAKKMAGKAKKLEKVKGKTIPKSNTLGYLEHV